MVAGNADQTVLVVRAWNRRFPMSRRQQFFTIVYGTLNIMDGNVRWCSAGHPWPIHNSTDGAAPLPTKSNTAIGWLLDGRIFKDKSLTLKPGENMLLSRDEAIEATDPELNQFGELRLAELVLRESQNAPDHPQEAVVGVPEAWTTGEPEREDLSLLMMTWIGPRLPE